MPPRGFAPGNGSCGSLEMVLGGERSLPSFVGGEQTLQLFPGARSLARVTARSFLVSCGSLALTVPSWWVVFSIPAVSLPWWLPLGSFFVAAP